MMFVALCIDPMISIDVSTIKPSEPSYKMGIKSGGPTLYPRDQRWLEHHRIDPGNNLTRGSWKKLSQSCTIFGSPPKLWWILLHYCHPAKTCFFSRSEYTVYIWCGIACLSKPQHVKTKVNGYNPSSCGYKSMQGCKFGPIECHRSVRSVVNNSDRRAALAERF